MLRKAKISIRLAIGLTALLACVCITIWVFANMAKVVASKPLIRIPSAGMEPTLKSESVHAVNYFAYKSESPKVNDIVVFHPPDFIQNGEMAEYMFIQRCVGVAGDKIEIHGSKFYRNGAIVSEPFVASHSMFHFKLVKYKGEIIPLIIEDSVANSGSKTDAKFWLDDENEGAALIKQVPAAIPEGHIIVMGDNRNGSFDSRSWGLLPISRVLGKLIQL